MTLYQIRTDANGTNMTFAQLCLERGWKPEDVRWERSRNGDANRKDHAFHGGFWYAHTDGLVDFIVPGEGQFFGYGFEAVAPRAGPAGPVRRPTRWGALKMEFICTQLNATMAQCQEVVVESNAGLLWLWPPVVVVVVVFVLVARS